MTQLERFSATMARTPGLAPLYFVSCTPECGQRLLAYTGLASMREFIDKFGVFDPQEAPCVKQHIPADATGYFDNYPQKPGSTIDHNGVLHEPGSMFHFTHYVAPLRDITTLEEAKRYAYPRKIMGDPADVQAFVAQEHARGRVVQAWVGHMYESAWQVRGYEQFLEDMLVAPEICTYILNQYCELACQSARVAALGGVDLLRTGDDIASQNALMFKPDLWRAMIKPTIAKVCATAKAIKPDIQIWYHSDGNITSVIDDLIEVGVTILNPVQPECLNVAELARKYGGKLVFDGVIGTQSTMPFGTPAQVRAAVRQAACDVGPGLMLAPTHVLEPEVPPQNIMAFIEACMEFA